VSVRHCQLRAVRDGDDRRELRRHQRLARSFTPLGGLVPLVNIMLGEVIFGGVGADVRHPRIHHPVGVHCGPDGGTDAEYLGKRVQAYDVQMAMLVILVFPLTILVLTAISVVAPTFGTSSVLNPGPHGLSEILYAFTSGTGKTGRRSAV